MRPISYAKCHPDRLNYAHSKCRECWTHTYVRNPKRMNHNRLQARIKGRGYLLKSRYGISEQEYNALNAKQGGLCAICHQPPRGKMKRLSVDHDHVTNIVRGLLCITCNRTIGYLENAEWRKTADSYLYWASCRAAAQQEINRLQHIVQSVVQ